MELRPEWIALIGAIVGAALAALAPLLSSSVAHRRELWLKKREEKLKRFEEIYERLASLEADIQFKYHPSVLKIFNQLDIEPEEPLDFARLDMLIGFYAPEVEKSYTELRDSIFHLYGEYVEWGGVAAQGRITENKHKLTEHNNMWMVTLHKIQVLKDEIAKHAQSFEL